MKKILLTTIAIALLSGTALAQRYDAQRYDGRAAPAPRYEQRGRFDEGDRIPYDYMKGGKYIYYDWRNAGLERPPRGYAWMKIGDQLLLADQQSGRITETAPVRAIRLRWTEGGIVPYDYRKGGHYIEYNWRGAELTPPPSGYAWMRIGDVYLLADQQSGRIEKIRPVRRDR